MKRIFFLLFYLFSIPVLAEEKPVSFSLDAGRSRDDINVYRVGVQSDFTDWLKNKDVALSGYLESSLNYWKSSADEIVGIAFSPVFYVPLCENCQTVPYLEAGVGLALISKKIIKQRNMSSTFQFEDRLGFGIKAGNFDFHLRYMHYSNAGLVNPNDGIDIFIAGVAIQF